MEKERRKVMWGEGSDLSRKERERGRKKEMEENNSDSPGETDTAKPLVSLQNSPGPPKSLHHLDGAPRGRQD